MTVHCGDFSPYRRIAMTVHCDGFSAYRRIAMTVHCDGFYTSRRIAMTVRCDVLRVRRCSAEGRIYLSTGHRPVKQRPNQNARPVRAT